MLLLVRLKDRPRRFGELRREIEGITKKMLTQALRRLERDGLISRRTLSARPLAIEYLLTERGRDVVPIVASSSSVLRAIGGQFTIRTERSTRIPNSEHGKRL